MRRRAPLTLTDLETWSDRQARGHALETVVVNLFRSLHFAVTHNPGVSSPRQTDLLAVKLDDRYLVECKWQSKPADTSDYDALRARLGRTSTDVIGLLISMNGFTAELVEEVRRGRRQPVLLLSSDELRSAESAPTTLMDLLYRKREALTRDAHVLLDEPRRRSPASLPYPESPRRLHSLTGDDMTSVEFLGAFGPVAFVEHVTDVNWTTSLGQGASLDIDVDAEDETQIIGVLNTLVDLGWVTDRGSWSIQQLNREWHGLGMKSLIDTLPDWHSRVDHHSEQIVYVDDCDGGFYSLLTDLSADELRRTRTASLSFQLDGVPLDPTPWQQLSRSLGVHEGLRVRPHDQESIRTDRFEDGLVPVAVQAWIVEEDWRAGVAETWATGAVVSNPFYQHEWAERGLTTPDGLEALNRSEWILCSLRHYHPVIEPKPQYYLSRIQWAWTADVLVCAPFVDWP